jgi:prepilin-type N-terminal cleavage/methylation domain-containing protein/prepilin-type processing-associated H-X9-DG protein
VLRLKQSCRWRLPASSGFTLVELLVTITIVAVLGGMILPLVADAMRQTRQTQCLSNQRQIGLALHSYASENGEFPPTTHSTGTMGKERSWIFSLADYLDEVDRVRVCPADPPARQRQIITRQATSYTLNDLVFDSAQFHKSSLIPRPGRTLLLAVLSENRSPSTTRDHIHGAEWTTWGAALSDIEPDRHRRGGRARDRMKGASNYLFADGSARSITARDFKSYFDQGVNPAEVPTELN